LRFLTLLISSKGDAVGRSMATVMGVVGKVGLVRLSVYIVAGSGGRCLLCCLLGVTGGT